VPVSEGYSDAGRPNYPGNWGKAGGKTRERRENLLAVSSLGSGACPAERAW